MCRRNGTSEALHAKANQFLPFAKHSPRVTILTDKERARREADGFAKLSAGRASMARLYANGQERRQAAITS